MKSLNVTFVKGATWGGAVGFLVLASCASYPAPTDRVANATAAVRAAQEVGAGSNPQAALYLKLAQEQTAQAKQLLDDGNNERADYVAQRAQADAELAVSLAKEASTKAKAAEVTKPKDQQ